MLERKMSRRELIATIGIGAIAGIIGESALNHIFQASEEESNTKLKNSPDTTIPRAEAPGRKLSLEDFVDLYKPYAEKVYHIYGINADVVLAQSYLETGGASSELASEAKAFFGIKSKDDWSGSVHSVKTEEFYTQKQIDAITKNDPTRTITVQETLPGGKKRVELAEQFRKYDTVLDSFMDYGDRITNSGYYDKALNHLNDPLAYIETISPIYATDDKYKEKLVKNYTDIINLS